MYEEGDIAVVKIEATGLPAAVIGDSDQVQLGETVYAVGNPGGTLSGTITDGIISSVDRTINVSLEETSNYGWNTGRTVSLEVLQTSAAVSPGNSGGGLFNSRGRTDWYCEREELRKQPGGSWLCDPGEPGYGDRRIAD